MSDSVWNDITSSLVPPVKPPLHPGAHALVYLSLPAGGSVDHPEALAQLELIERECARRGLEFEKVIHDSEPKSNGVGRPGLAYALEQLAGGQATHLVVSDLDRLGGSLVELGEIFQWFEHSEATLIVVEQDIDSSKPTGRLVGNIMLSMAGSERDRRTRRTQRGLEAARAGAQVKRPSVSDIPGLKDRIVSMRENGMTLQAIADQLNEEAVPTLRGGTRWRPSSVQAAAGYKRPQRSRVGADLPPPRPAQSDEGGRT